MTQSAPGLEGPGHRIRDDQEAPAAGGDHRDGAGAGSLDMTVSTVAAPAVALVVVGEVLGIETNAGRGAELRRGAGG